MPVICVLTMVQRLPTDLIFTVRSEVLQNTSDNLNLTITWLQDADTVAGRPHITSTPEAEEWGTRLRTAEAANEAHLTAANLALPNLKMPHYYNNDFTFK